MRYEIGLIGPDGTASEIQGPFNTASQAAAVAEHLNAIAHGLNANWKWAREGEIVVNDGKLYFLILSKGLARSSYTVIGPYKSAALAQADMPQHNGEVFLVATL